MALAHSVLSVRVWGCRGPHARESDGNYKKMERELLKRTGGLFVKPDPQAPRSLRKAKEKVCIIAPKCKLVDIQLAFQLAAGRIEGVLLRCST